MKGLLENQAALVTGGTSGIGRAIALALTEAGADVVVTGVTQGEVQNFDIDGRALRVVKLDVTLPEEIERLVSSLDRLDILVNCAGIILRDRQEFDPRQFARVIDVNLNGMMRVSSACHPLLARRGGNVINMASMLSFFGSGFVPAYSASKGGVVQFTRSLAIAWADDKIRVNAIAPGWIETALTKPLVQDERRSKMILDRTPLKRWGEPADVAGAAVFLCSPAAAFITGAVLPVDGGYSIA